MGDCNGTNVWGYWVVGYGVYRVFGTETLQRHYMVMVVGMFATVWPLGNYNTYSVIDCFSDGFCKKVVDKLDYSMLLANQKGCEYTLTGFNQRTVRHPLNEVSR
jgi:hypothetical protein